MVDAGVGDMMVVGPLCNSNSRIMRSSLLGDILREPKGVRLLLGHTEWRVLHKGGVFVTNGAGNAISQ